MQDVLREAKKQKVVRYIEDDELNTELVKFAENDDPDEFKREEIFLVFAKAQRHVIVTGSSSQRATPAPADESQHLSTPVSDSYAAVTIPSLLDLQKVLDCILDIVSNDILDKLCVGDRLGICEWTENETVVEYRKRLEGWKPMGFMNVTEKSEEAKTQTLAISIGGTEWTRAKVALKLALCFPTFFPKGEELTIVDELNLLTPLASPEDGIEKYIPGFVNAVPDDYTNLLMVPLDRSKGAALVVGGESGSGKTWFVRHNLRDYAVKNKKAAAFLYHCLVQKDLKEPCPIPTEHDKEVAQVLGEAMRVLHNRGISEGPVYNKLSERNSLLRKNRNEWARDLLYKIIAEKCESSPRLQEWWGGKKPEAVKHLVLALDEGGKNLDFTRALVDGVRDIYNDLAVKGVATSVLLSISGSGLERMIDIDSPYPGMGEIAALGTDPMKSNFIVLTKPSIDKLPETLLCKSAILKGTYSRILSTNTRMLMRGVIPILNEDKLLLKVAPTRLDQRFIDLGSTNIVMDYAVRVYFALNGLANIDEQDRGKLLLQAFKHLMAESVKSVRANPVSVTMFIALRVDAEVLDQLLSKGLVAAEASNTSNALRYLACDGQTFPLIPADGLSLEVVLKLHLCRLKKAMGYNSMTYDLLEAWPPKSTKGDLVLEDAHAINGELKSRYSGHSLVDITALIQLIEREEKDGPTKVAVVLGQKNATAQGPDVMVLSIDYEDSKRTKATLDLYQAKNYSNAFKFKTKKLRASVRSLGISIDGEPGKGDVDPNKGSAGYSNHGIIFFARCLAKKLCVSVSISDRVLVVSMPLVELDWDAAAFDKAKNCGLTVWTKEQMEPTISALVLAPAVFDIEAQRCASLSWDRIMLPTSTD